jgi:hypothetical protein
MSLGSPSQHLANFYRVLAVAHPRAVIVPQVPKRASSQQMHSAAQDIRYVLHAHYARLQSPIESRTYRREGAQPSLEFLRTASWTLEQVHVALSQLAAVEAQAARLTRACEGDRLRRRTSSYMSGLSVQRLEMENAGVRKAAVEAGLLGEGALHLLQALATTLKGFESALVTSNQAVIW